MNCLIDTNILIDFLQKREGYYEDASLIFHCCEANMVKAHISALSFADLVYIMRKELTSTLIEEVLRKLGTFLEIENLETDDLYKAAKMHNQDFEDALLIKCAERIQVDYIVTRNTKHFNKSNVKAVTPKEFINYITLS